MFFANCKNIKLLLNKDPSFDSQIRSQPYILYLSNSHFLLGLTLDSRPNGAITFWESALYTENTQQVPSTEVTLLQVHTILIHTYMRVWKY